MTDSDQIYCLKCREKRDVLGAHQITMKNGRRASQGKCAVCGTTVTKIGG